MSGSRATADNETLDTIKDIKIIQAKEGYRFSVDALLLENFITAKRLEKGIELGAGSGDNIHSSRKEAREP